MENLPPQPLLTMPTDEEWVTLDLKVTSLYVTFGPYGRSVPRHSFAFRLEISSKNRFFLFLLGKEWIALSNGSGLDMKLNTACRGAGV